jgi:undecaprenyl-diphosphatase
MTTFQAIIYGIVHGFAELLPIGAEAHRWALAHALDWPLPDAGLAAALGLGSALAVFLYFIHDWASIVSSLLQVIIYRRKPMTLDERMPFFLLITSAPSVALWYYLRTNPLEVPEATPMIFAGALAGLSLLLLGGESFSRKNKNMFDWNWLDSLMVGIGQAVALLPLVGPALGRSAGAVSGALFRNYSREAAAKFTFLAALPLLVAQFVTDLRATVPDETSWLTIGAGFVVSLAAGLLAIGGMMRNVQRKGYRGYAFYRIAIAAVLAGYFWFIHRG